MRRRLCLTLLLALHVGLRLAVWARPLRELDDLVLPDDAYLSLHLARSIAHGLGPWYGLAPTNGFQPLYVFLMAPVFALTGGDPVIPVRVALLLLVAADAIAMLLTVRLALRLGCSLAAATVAGLVWALSAWSLRTSLNGLETSIATAAIAATLLQWDRLRSGVPRDTSVLAWGGLGVLGGIAYLARIDSLVLAPALAVPLLAGAGASRSPRAGRWRGLAIAAAAAFAVALPWLLYSWRWTHSLFPASGRAVRELQLSVVHHAPTWANTYAPMIARAARALASNAGVPVAIAGSLALAALAASRGEATGRMVRRLRPLLPLAAFGAMLVAAYTLVVFGPWYFGRYFYPLLIPVVLAVAIFADELLRAVGKRRLAAVSAVAVLVLAGSVADPKLRALFRPGAPPQWGYLRIGEWARAHYAPRTIIGGPQTGALGYFADSLTVVNLDGVVNRSALAAMQRRDLLGYIRRTGIQEVVWQDDIDVVRRETRRPDPRALTLLGLVPGIETQRAPWRIYRVEPAAGDRAGAVPDSKPAAK